MYAVKSKYKNPDRFIGRLQDEIKRRKTWADSDRERMGQLRGEHIVSWAKSSDVYHHNLSDDCDLGNFHVNDKVAIIGRVVKVMESTCNTGNRESSIDYQLLETRCIKE